MGLTDKPVFDKVTKLYMDMEICSEFIGCWHWEFERQSFEEKMKWYLFREMKIERDLNRIEKDKEKSKTRQLEMKQKSNNRKMLGRQPKITRGRGR